MRRALIRRQIGLWLLVRSMKYLFWILVAAGAGITAEVRFAQPDAAIVLVAVALGAVEIAIRRERILLGNLGISWAQLAAIIGLPTVALEAVLLIVART